MQHIDNLKEADYQTLFNAGNGLILVLLADDVLNSKMTIMISLNY